MTADETVGGSTNAPHLARQHTFSALLDSVPGARILSGGDRAITSIAYDSRQVQPGGLFVALRGSYVDGHDYIAAARERGAAGCLVDRDPATLDLDGFEAVAVAPDSRQALAQVACRYFGDPSHDLCLIGITGTDGKTTTSYMVDHLLTTAGRATGLIGTIETKIPGQAARSSGRQTTPESLETQRLLAEMRAAGADAVVLETSSHGLETFRVDGCHFDVGIVTNITHEHLDFHGTVEAYRRAKARLLDRLADAAGSGGAGLAVVNFDDPGARSILSHAAQLRLVTYGMAPDSAADVVATDIEPVPGGYRINVHSPFGAGAVTIPMIGRWNISNALAAVAACGSLDVDLDVILEGLGTIPHVPGRMARVDAGQPFQVIVDYAHTAPALQGLLGAARETTEGRVLVLFGSAGERDVEKRSDMGAIAADLADYFVVTSEDPRFEDPESILAQIAEGAVRTGATEGVDFVRLEDRRSAIEHVLERAGRGDSVILAGKGHERSMIYGAEERPWDEAAVAREVLNAMGYTQN